MKKSIGFLIISVILIVWFAVSINILIRYNLHWIDYIKYSFNLTDNEMDYLNGTEITCGVKYNDLPLSFVNSDMQNDGILIDFISQLSVELENDMVVELNSKGTLEEELRNGDIQAAIIDKNYRTEQKFLFTEPIYIMHGKMLVKEDSKYGNINQLENVKVAVESSDTDMANRIIELYGDKGIEVASAENIGDAMQMLEEDKVAAVAGDETRLSYYLNQQHNAQYYRFLKYSFSRKEVCIAVSRSDEKLLLMLNKSILSMKKKNLVIKTQSKWFGALEPEAVDMKEVDFLYQITFLFIMVAVGFTVWNLSTARKVTEKTRELLNSKEQLRLIIDTLDRGLVIAAKDGAIIEINKEISKITDQSEEELLGSDVKEGAISAFISHKDGEVFKWSNRYYVKQTIDIYDDDKKLYVIEDCTQRRINEVLNIQEEKMIAVGHLSAGLAHEIRNPLGLIKSYVYVIKKFCTGEDGMHAVSVINDSISRINNLIESLLKFSKLSNDEYREVDLEELVNDILLLERKTMKNRDIDVSYTVNAENGTCVLINDDLMKMIIINLLNNGIDAIEETGRKGNIDIEMAVKNESLEITFRDNGCGVDSRKILEIFNPFYSGKEKGTGLGLYVISTQLEQIGGSIRAESTVGEGTVFYIEMPLRRKEVEQ